MTVHVFKRAVENTLKVSKSGYLQLREPFDGLERPENSQHSQRLDSLDVSAFVVSAIEKKKPNLTLVAL